MRFRLSRLRLEVLGIRRPGSVELSCWAFWGVVSEVQAVKGPSNESPELRSLECSPQRDPKHLYRVDCRVSSSGTITI